MNYKGVLSCVTSYFLKLSLPSALTSPLHNRSLTRAVHHPPFISYMENVKIDLNALASLSVYEVSMAEFLLFIFLYVCQALVLILTCLCIAPVWSWVTGIALLHYFSVMKKLSATTFLCFWQIFHTGKGDSFDDWPVGGSLPGQCIHKIVIGNITS